MGIELGSIGSAIGNVASGISKAGAEVAPALASFGEVMKAPIGNIVNEGPVGRGFLEGFRSMNITDITTIDPGGTVAPLGEILFQAKPKMPEIGEAGTIASVENFLAQEARIPEVVGPMIMPRAEPVFAPLRTPNVVEFPKPQLVLSPTLEPVTKTENRVAALPTPVMLPQPLPEAQVLKEETVTERVATKQIDIVEEEKTSLKDVVDIEVLNKREELLIGAVELAGTEMEEIDGKRIIELVGPETVEKRSGLVKNTGPDGSWVDTVGVVASKKFKSVKEAKEKIVAIITQNVPVKRAKEGITVGYEAVARVLKYFFAKARPAEQTVIRATKKQLD